MAELMERDDSKRIAHGVGHSYRLASGTWGKAKAGAQLQVIASETWGKAKAGAQLRL